MTTAVAVLEAFAASSGIFALMNSAWGWPIAESLHFLGLALLVGTVGVFDLCLLGLLRAIPVAALHPLVRWGVAGFLVNVITGVCFLVSDPGQYLYNPAFQLKALCILLAGLNVLWFYVMVFRHTMLDGFVPSAARLSAGISLVSWVGVIIFGRLITFYRPPEHWCWWC